MNAMKLRSLHRRGDPLVLVNAWDVASAERVVAAGGRAVATSSAAIAASLGLPDDLVRRLLATGAVGCNLEDSDHARPGELLDPDTVADRIAAVRAAGVKAGVDVVVNARIDSYLHHGPAATADVLSRARRYLDAGAGCVYPIRLTDPGTVARLVDSLDAAVNANLSPQVRVADLAAAGASRISIGPRAYHAALTAVDHLAADMLKA
jgi:2-methylisocitrate lyase-like PEP mutase family enzyme